MDNVCHTLVGAAMAEAGLKRRTRYGAAALMIAANLPDLDVLVFATDTPSVSFRRGWTHGVLAQALLPVALTLAVTACARSLAPARADARAAAGRRCRRWWLLALGVPRRLLARLPRLLEQLRRAAADAGRLALVLRRRGVHRRSVALAGAGRRACGWRGGGDRRSRRPSALGVAAGYVAVMLALGRRLARGGHARVAGGARLRRRAR